MDRRRRQPRTVQDFVRAGVLRPVQPTTATGWIKYATGVQCLSAANGDNALGVKTTLAYPASYGLTDIMDEVEGTIAVRCIPGWAGDDGAHHGLVSGSYTTSTTRISLVKNSSNRWILLLNNTDTAYAGGMSFAANTTHVLVARWNATTADLNHDGTSVTQDEHEIAVEQPDYFGVGDWYGVASREWNGYVGPVIVSPDRKSDAWVAAIQADSGAAYSSIPRLVRDFMSVGDLLIPYTGDATAYLKSGGSHPFAT